MGVPVDGAHRHEGCQPKSLAELTSHLRRGDRRLTGPRQAILSVLRQAPHPLSNKQIHAALPGGACDLATVYRSLHLLEKLNMVQRYDFGDGVARFELQDPDGHDHHHHLVCRRCAAVVELDECDLDEFQQRVAAHSGFTLVSHRLEFFGLCPRCQ
jgi:Fe2+ or Zn2+ uptake regulation protein